MQKFIPSIHTFYQLALVLTLTMAGLLGQTSAFAQERPINDAAEETREAVDAVGDAAEEVADDVEDAAKNVKKFEVIPIEKGRFAVGGGGSITSVNPKDGDGGTILNLNPTALYFLSNHWAIGARLNWSAQFGEFGSMSIFPMVRYYRENGWFGQLGTGFTLNGADDDDAGGTGLVFNLGVGYSYFLNRDVSLEPIAELQLSGTGTQFNIGAGFIIFLR